MTIKERVFSRNRSEIKSSENFEKYKMRKLEKFFENLKSFESLEKFRKHSRNLGKKIIFLKNLMLFRKKYFFLFFEISLFRNYMKKRIIILLPNHVIFLKYNQNYKNSGNDFEL